MLAGSIVRRGARRGLGTSRPPRRLRGLPALAGDPSPALAPLLAAQLVALSNLGAAMPPPEAAARLLGSALEGGAHFERRGTSLRGLLRQRVEALHGEFRGVPGPFELVEVGGHPGIARRGANEAWLGRLMLLNTPADRLAGALEAWEYPVPGFLDRTAPSRRRAAVHYRIAREALPEALARRAILVPEAGPSACVTLALHPGETRENAEIVAATRVADEAEALEPGAEAIEAALRALLPFGVESMVRLAAATRPVWDDDLALVDPPAGRGWPADVDTRCSSRPLVHALAREQVAALGVEGDLLLGWHAGDALTTDLA